MVPSTLMDVMLSLASADAVFNRHFFPVQRRLLLPDPPRD